MTTVLAALDDSPVAGAVVRAARAFGRTFGADVRAVHVIDQDVDTSADIAESVGVAIETVRGDPVAEIIAAASQADVQAVVVGARRDTAGRRPAGHVAQAVMTGVRKPVLIVPPDARVADGPWRRALVPLEGSAASSEAVADIVRRLGAAGVDVVAVHVFRPATAPKFWDQAGHADQSWTTEFLARSCTGAPDAELHLRTGDVGDAALDVATQQAIDLVVLGWSQHFAPDRAQVVRAIVARADVPILLVPTA